MTEASEREYFRVARAEVLTQMLAEAPDAMDTFLFAAAIGRDLAREHVDGHRMAIETLLKVRCGRRRCQLASVWPTPWGSWVECPGYRPTPAGGRDLATAGDDYATTASQVVTRGRYPDECGLLTVGE
jgi:hypothetical protein